MIPNLKFIKSGSPKQLHKSSSAFVIIVPVNGTEHPSLAESYHMFCLG